MARVDPYAGYNFSVELDGITRAGFRECSGLETSQDAGEYREGTDRNLAVRKIPGLNTYGDITLSRGFTSDSKLWEWREKAMKGTVERHDRSGCIAQRLRTGARASSSPAEQPERTSSVVAASLETD